MGYVKGQDRRQVIISSLDEMITEDNPVRLMDLLVEGLISQAPEKYRWKGHSKSGRPAYSASDLLKLYLYGYSNKIVSSRKLEMECHRNLELKWLLNNLTPDFKTIADYRRDNAEAISEMTISFNVLLKSKELIRGDLMAIDGTKIKANANPGKNLSQSEVTAKICEYEKEILRYLYLLQDNDIKDDLVELDEGKLNTVESIQDKISDLTDKKEHLEECLNRIKKNRGSNASSSDPESRLVKNRQELFYGYNLQVIVDSLHKLIATAQMRQSPNDLHQMLPALETLKKELGIEPEIIVGDKGYDNPSALQAVEQSGKTEVYVPVEESRDQYVKQNFIFDEENNCYICPRGHTLKQKRGLHKSRGRMGILYQCKAEICNKCPDKGSCTDAKNGRSITRLVDEQWREDYVKRVQSESVKSLLQRRMCLIEHVFGVLKCRMGKIPLLLRGRDKVQTEINLYVTAYNMNRIITILGFDKVREMIMSMNTPV